MFMKMPPAAFDISLQRWLESVRALGVFDLPLLAFGVSHHVIRRAVHAHERARTVAINAFGIGLAGGGWRGLLIGFQIRFPQPRLAVATGHGFEPVIERRLLFSHFAQHVFQHFAADRERGHLGDALDHIQQVRQGFVPLAVRPVDHAFVHITDDVDDCRDRHQLTKHRHEK